jgi:hypothetical protein
MNSEQVDVMNAVQEVLRGVVMAVVAVDPDKASTVAKALSAFAKRPGAATLVQTMLADLAKGPQAVAVARGL